jgi:hypothetical protein
MYRVLTGKQRSLVFPVMANACVKINYNDNIPVGDDGFYQTADDVTYGIWGHQDSFTIEATVTPYDVNGYGKHSLGSHSVSPPSTEKVMPAPNNDQLATPDSYLSDLYMSRTDRLTHEMAVFHSTNVQLYLVNTTEHNENSPAEYKIRFMVNIGGTAVTLDSPTVFKSVFGKSLTTPTNTDSVIINEEGKVTHEKIATITTQLATLVLDGDYRTKFHFPNQEIFIKDGFSAKLLGKTTNRTGNVTTTLTLDTSYDSHLYDGVDIFLPTLKHPAYISNFNHIAATYNESTKEMSIYYDNNLVANTFHTATTTFSFRSNITNEEDLFLGANGTNATGTNSAKTNKQFMGELHEFAISAIASNNFNVFNLTPRYAHTLLYFRFEEVDD